MRTSILTTVVLVTALSFISCSKSEAPAKKETTAVVAVGRAPFTFNPVIAKSPEAQLLASLVYPGMFFKEYDTKKNKVVYTPQIASWSEPFGSYVMVRIKPGTMWSDDIPVSAKDVIYSYQLYANEQLGTVWRPLLNGLKTDAAGNIDLAAAIEMDDDSTLTFNFVSDSAVNYDVFTVPIVPRHQMDALPSVQLKAAIPTKTPTIAGPFIVASLSDQEVILRPNPASAAPKPAGVDQLILRVIAGAKARTDAFTAGQLDIATGLTAADVTRIKEVREDIEVITYPPLRYHAIGWNTIDPESYKSSNGEKVKSNRMFGTPLIRRAMTIALDRGKILTEVIGADVVKSFGPVSPMFATQYHDTLHQLYCDPMETKMVLAKDLWQDLTKSGTVEKFNRPFAFSLMVSADDEAGKRIAEMVKVQLKEVSIDVTVEPLEPAAFAEALATKQFDAFIGAVDVPQTLDLRRDLGIDLKRADRNYVSFRNKRVSEIIDSTVTALPQADNIRLWKELQDILQEQQPYTFLYWESQYAVRSKKLNGVRFTPLGYMARPWEWTVSGQ